LNRFKLLIAYDGRAFRGWQSQATKDSIQDHLELALAKLNGGLRVPVHGAGRTDAGVHALGQVAHIDLPPGALPPARLSLALNANMPAAIRVLRITRAHADFHARFDARGKIYTYRIWNHQVLHPLEVGRAWHLPGELDLAALRNAAALLEGTHDFASFAAHRGKPEKDTVRTIYSARIRRTGALLTLQFTGSGFLYRMVRLLTGSVIRCAQQRAELAWIERLLAEPGVVKTSFAAPAEGLYLTRVLYKPVDVAGQAVKTTL
jgi:tRNA pseudouridine38-40 synthase